MKTGVMLLAGLGILWAQRTPDGEAAALIDKAREKGLAYSQSLPDFVCSEVVHRYAQRGPQALRAYRSVPTNGLPNWQPVDKLTVRISFFQQEEQHKLVLVNDEPTAQKYESLAGGIETGEFGGTVHGIFDPATATDFHWQAWKSVRRHRAGVYAYRVDAVHSRYEIASGSPTDLRQAIVGFHGAMEIDRETGEVLHFTYIADDIPRNIDIKAVRTTVDYDFADVGGNRYLLPSHCEAEIFSPQLSVRNVIEFQEYRKFSADSSIQFGAGK